MKTIRELRQTQGLTQQDLAVKLGLSVATVGTWERGATLPSARQLRALGQLFGICSDEIELIERPEARRRRRGRADDSE